MQVSALGVSGGQLGSKHPRAPPGQEGALTTSVFFAARVFFILREGVKHRPVAWQASHHKIGAKRTHAGNLTAHVTTRAGQQPHHTRQRSQPCCALRLRIRAG